MHKKNCREQNLGESVCIFAFFHFPDSELYLLNGFDVDFNLFWMAWHWKPTIVVQMISPFNQLSTSFTYVLDWN